MRVDREDEKQEKEINEEDEEEEANAVLKNHNPTPTITSRRY